MRSWAALVVVGLALTGACSFEFELESRTYKCARDDECLVDEDYHCNLALETPICERVLPENEDIPVCHDNDNDNWGVGPVGCRKCPDPPCAPEVEDPDDANALVYPGAPERCDGVDNDGDALVDTEDDGYVPTKCRLQIGACVGAVRPCGGAAGPQDCKDLDYFANNPAYSADEVCGDAVDNDCDGEADPPAKCQCRAGDQEPCRASAFGVCAAGVGNKTCMEGAWGPCEGAIEPSPELCDGLDNDCDGRVDEDAEDPDVSVCGPCPHDMIFLEADGGRWCVDRWEASRDPDTPARPRSASGAIPWTTISFNDVTTACALASAGRLGVKEVCPITIWTAACKSPNAFSYPYGNEFQAEQCNGNGGAAEPTGGRITCFSPWPDRGGAEGSGQVFDMSGNVAEWVRPPPQDQTRKLVYGGAYSSGGDPGRLSCDGMEDRQGDVSGRADIGFRCCKKLE